MVSENAMKILKNNGYDWANFVETQSNILSMLSFNWAKLDISGERHICTIVFESIISSILK